MDAVQSQKFLEEGMKRLNAAGCVGECFMATGEFPDAADFLSDKVCLKSSQDVCSLCGELHILLDTLLHISCIAVKS